MPPGDTWRIMFKFAAASIPVYIPGRFFYLDQIASLSYSLCQLPYGYVVCLKSGIDLTLVEFFQSKTYFPEVLCSASHEFIQSSSSVRVMYLWDKCV